MLKAPLLAVTLLVPANCVVSFDECRHEEPRQATLDADGITEVIVDARAGSLRIEGSSSSGEIRIDGTACAARSRELDRIELIAERSGHQARIEARIEPRSRYGNARLDLEIVVPEGLAIVVDDSSGNVDIHGVASLRIRDGSGDIRIEGVAGEVRVDDGSGDVRIRDSGSVVIDDDGSGDIDIEGVTGDVVVRDDGSGDIVVSAVGGSLTVRDSGSGDVDYADITGDVDIR